MSLNTGFDERFGEFLESGPVRAPDALFNDVLAAFPAIPQRRPRPWHRVGRRVAHVSPRLRLAAVAAVAAVAIVATLATFRLFNPIQGPGVNPDVTPDVKLDFYSESRYPYLIGYPEGWIVSAATQDLGSVETPWVDSPAVDNFSRGGGSEILFIVAAAPVSLGTTPEEWAAATTLVICGEPTTERPVMIDGEVGRLYEYNLCNSYRHSWAVVIHGDTAFHIVWLGTSADPEYDRRRFNAILASFRFTD